MFESTNKRDTLIKDWVNDYKWPVIHMYNVLLGRRVIKHAARQRTVRPVNGCCCA